MDDRDGCLTQILELVGLVFVFEWLERRFGFGRGCSCGGCGCGLLILVLMLIALVAVLTGSFHL